MYTHCNQAVLCTSESNVHLFIVFEQGFMTLLVTQRNDVIKSGVMKVFSCQN